MPFDPDEFIKKYKPDKPTMPVLPTTPAAPTAAAPATTPEATDPDAEPSWLEGHDIEHGLKRGAARFGTDVVEFNKSVMPHIFPSLSRGLQTLVPESVKEKYREMREYGQQPSETTTEAIAAGGAEMLPFLVGGPENLAAKGAQRAVTRGLARVLPRSVPRMVPGAPVYAGAGQWIAGPAQQVGGGITRQAARFARKMGQRAGGLTGTAVSSGEGAVTGAMTDPEHPVEGAEAGAIGGLVPPVVGGAARSRAGRWALAHLPGSALSTLAFMGLHGLGAPGWLAHGLTIPNIRWHSSPIGRRLTRIGPHIIDNHGNLVGTIANPAMTGAVAGKVRGSMPEEEGDDNQGN